MFGLRFFVSIGLMLAAAASADAARPGAAPPDRARFDCARAASPRERTICATPALAALDRQLGRLYRDKLALLSTDGAATLRKGQRGWLAFASTVCAPSSRQTDPARCLEDRYAERIEDLRNVRRLGPFVFDRVDLYAATPAPDDGGAARGFFVYHVAYPQIDRAASAAIVAWNRAAVRRLDAASDCGVEGDASTDYRLGYASGRLVSVAWQEYAYCHGTPHGFGTTQVENTILSDPPRPLAPADLFGPGDAWRRPLRAAFRRALTASGWHAPSADEHAGGDLIDDIVQPDRWLIGSAGITVSFSSYEGGCYVCAPPPITLPWSTIAPLLKAGAIAP